jgi:sugar (pentulose or hexulose) kinase
VVLAVDVGSSRTRVSLVDTDGRTVGHGSAPTPVENPGAGRSELSVECLWDVLAAVTRELGPAAAEARAIGISGLMSTAFLDAEGRPVGPALLWNDDRAAACAKAAGGGLARLTEDIALRPPTGEMWGPRLAWLAEHQPERRAAVRHLGTVKDAIVARLTGGVATDPTAASYTGLLDVAAGTWSAAAAAGWGVDPDLLPPLAAAAAPAGGLTEEAAAELRLPAGVPVCTGAPDGSVGALAAGGVAAGFTVDIAGTSDVINHLLDRPHRGGGGTVLNAFVVPGLWGLGGPTGMTGGAVAWTARLLGYGSVGQALAALGPEIDRIGPGAGGVCMRPHLSGSRFPEWASEAGGSIAGLRPEHGPAHLLAAALEGAAFTVAHGIEAIRAAGSPVTELRVGGGPAADRRSLRLRATAAGVPVRAALDPEMSTLGAATLAAVCAGLFDDLAEAVAALGPEAETVEPDEDAASALRAAFERWREAGPTAA